MENAKLSGQREDYAWAMRARWDMPKSYAHYLINKYIVIKKDVLNDVTKFCENNSFDSHQMIGVHYRGTDKTFTSLKKKNAEAAAVTYDEMFRFMDEAKKKTSKL